jgi:deoxyribonuclease V
LIAAFDVCYEGDVRATAAAVIFRDYADARPGSEFLLLTKSVFPYVSGQFWRRELPCVLALIEQLDEVPDEIVIDGYVMLGDKPGLGRHLFESLSGKVPVIGVAKSPHRDAKAIEVFRGESKRPLYVTSAGVDVREAAKRIRQMHGAHRLPTLLKRVDMLARGRAQAKANPGVVSDGQAQS